MRVRALIASDIPALLAMQAEYPYPSLDGALEAVSVVVDDDDKPICAAAAKRLIEAYFWCGKFSSPMAGLHALRLLHDDLAVQLRERGYSEIEAFLPPPVAAQFSRRLKKSFGWRPNWPSLNRRF
jgi:hypothetical protein